jgi:hypothetical protein
MFFEQQCSSYFIAIAERNSRLHSRNLGRCRLWPTSWFACALGLLSSGLAPTAALACACGCGVFDVGALSMLPTRPGWMVFLEDDYQDQNQNWVGSSAAPASANTDKEIETHFVSFGIDYQFNSDWGVNVRIPYWDRLFRTDIGTPEEPDIQDYRHSALGDIRITARYTGFSSDLSTGVTLGVKLATGDWTYPNFDRDTSIGTGTTDLLLGAYHVGTLSNTYQLQWFTEGLYEWATNTREGYRPGDELDVAAGLDYTGLRFGSTALIPLLQLIGSYRWRDSGINADPPNSGYHRLLISPGAQVNTGNWTFYADAEFRLYHYANAAPSVEVEGTQGQLVAPVLFKLIVSYSW